MKKLDLAALKTIAGGCAPACQPACAPQPSCAPKSSCCS